jgi:hypothetical protein
MRVHPLHHNTDDARGGPGHDQFALMHFDASCRERLGSLVADNTTVAGDRDRDKLIIVGPVSLEAAMFRCWHVVDRGRAEGGCDRRRRRRAYFFRKDKTLNCSECAT